MGRRYEDGEKSLQARFDDLNRRYWRGRLPRYRVRFSPGLRKRTGCIGQCDDSQHLIVIDPSETGTALRLTLLHEMCHVGNHHGAWHGPIFLRKLRRLERLGETGLVADIERYDGTLADRQVEEMRARGVTVQDVPASEFILDDLHEIAANGLYRAQWATIRRGLAKRYEISEAKLQRLAPTAEHTWRTLRREQYEFVRLQKVARQRMEQLAGGDDPKSESHE